jgi:hypothetical protein
MTSRKRKLANVYEKFLKNSYKKYVDQFFGENSNIEIRDLVFSPVKKVCLVDCVVHLGEDIDESYMNDEYVRHIIYKISEKVLHDYSINVMVTYDI